MMSLVIIGFMVVGGIFFFKMDHAHRQKVSWYESVHEDYKKSLNKAKVERKELKETIKDLEEVENMFKIFSGVMGSLECTLNIEYVDRFKEALRNMERGPWQPVDKAEFAELLWIYMPMYILNNPLEFTERFTHDSISNWVNKNVGQIYEDYKTIVDDASDFGFVVTEESDGITPFWSSLHFAEAIFNAVNQYDEGTFKSLSDLIDKEQE